MVDTNNAVAVIDAISQHTLDYALLLAAIGTLSMAFIEMLKGVFALRRKFHRQQVKRWICNSSAQHELLVLATGGEEYADVLFDQPIERMMGQIQAAANLSLEYPDRYPHVYQFFTEENLEVGAEADADKSDRKIWAAYAQDAAKSGVKAHAKEDVSRAAQQARVRLGNLIARRLDSFQNRTQYLWARYNQVASVAIGAGLSAFALNQGTKMDGVNGYLFLISLSLLAGMLAPFAKDVVTAVSGIRTKA
jgi:hypothetical protein